MLVKETLKDLVYLSSSHELPSYLHDLRGIRWFRSKNVDELKQFLSSQKNEIFVLIRADVITPRLLEAFLSWQFVKAQVIFIFIGHLIEKAAYQTSLNHKHILLLRESEGLRINDIVTRRISGEALKSRKQERKPLAAQVMVKKSSLDIASPTGKMVQFLKEARMKDFSQGGAQITLPQQTVGFKDFVSLMYQDGSGKWVSVESQVRWVVSMPSGEQIIGVQFLAVSA